MLSYQIFETAYFLAISVLLAGVPESGARGGKGAKGAGGGATRYGHRGLHNAAAYELTWEDMVLAMQLSAMCFGALIALCVVACCAYKICGPAEEEDWGRHYRSSFKISRLPPELLREIYTVPTSTSISSSSGMNEKIHAEGTPPTPPSNKTTFRQHNYTDASMLGTAVTTSEHQRLIPTQHVHHNLPNGRAVMQESRQGCLSLGNVLDHRPRGITLSSLSTSRLLSEARRPGVAPRLAAHLNNSTLDLSHPHSIMMPSLNASSRSLSEPKTAIV